MILNLRTTQSNSKLPWNIDQIRAGFEKFNELYGRFPTAHEIDSFEYLPTSRSLQRSFGGLVEVRSKLFPDAIANFTSGEYRQRIASDTFKRAQDYEEVFFSKLCLQFEEVAIHEHKIIRPGRVACDFFIYLDDSEGICLDLFFAKDMFSVAGVINNKLRRYSQLACPVVFVLLHGGNIDDAELDRNLSNRKNRLPEHITVISENRFWLDYIPSLKMQSQFNRAA